MDAGLLVLRGVVGPLMVAHGMGKVNGFAGAGYGIEGTAGFLESLGFKPGTSYAWATAASEIGSGAGIAAGLGTPLAGAGLIGVMATAARTAHAGKGPWATGGGWEYPLVLAAVGAALSFTGPGKWSLDRALGREQSGWLPFLGAVAVGLAGSAAAMSARKVVPPSLPGPDSP